MLDLGQSGPIGKIGGLIGPIGGLVGAIGGPIRPIGLIGHGPVGPIGLIGPMISVIVPIAHLQVTAAGSVGSWTL